MLAALTKQQVELNIERGRVESPEGAGMQQARAIDVKLSRLAIELEKLRKKVQLYQVHLEQYEKCRARVKEAEESITPGRMVMYRDFVNQHNPAGAKVNSLVLVVLYRDTIGGPIHKVALHNICTDAASQSCGAWYVRDVMDHHLSGRSNVCDGLFAKQKAAAKAAGFRGLEITVAGDHGPHFCSKNTFYNNTLFYALYGVVLTDSFLCSYHAFNVCDAAGCVSKRLAIAEMRDGWLPRALGAPYSHNSPPGNSLKVEFDYVAIINQSAHMNAYAFGFSKVNMSADLFPAKWKGDLGFITKKVCDVVYWCPHSSSSAASARGIAAARAGAVGAAHAVQEGGKDFIEGVLRCRLVPGQGEYAVIDMIPRSKDWGKMCTGCSNKAQRPVYHIRDKTSCLRTFDPPSKRGIVQPNLNRLVGVQRDKNWKKAVEKPLGSHPCMQFGCPHRNYNAAHHANRHMIKKHNIPVGDVRLYPAAPALPPKKRTRAVKEKAKRPRRDARPRVQHAPMLSSSADESFAMSASEASSSAFTAEEKSADDPAARTQETPDPPPPPPSPRKSAVVHLTAIQGAVSPHPVPFYLVDDTSQYYGKARRSDAFKGPYRRSWLDTADNKELQLPTRPPKSQSGHDVIALLADYAEADIIVRRLQLDAAGILTDKSVRRLVKAFETEPEELAAMVPQWAKDATAPRPDLVA
jgi:hypothetical protein